MGVVGDLATGLWRGSNGFSIGVSTFVYCIYIWVLVQVCRYIFLLLFPLLLVLHLA